jgi:hypothetical protein
MQEFLQREKIQAFSESLLTRDFHEGLFDFLQGHSIGALKANTVILQIPEFNDSLAMTQFFKTIELVATFNLNLVVLKSGNIDFTKRKKTIDLWWGDENNGSLMALFSYLMTQSQQWSGSRIRLLKAVEQGQNTERAQKVMAEIKRQARLEADIKVVSYKEDAYEVLKTASSQDADFVFIGMGATNGDEAKASIQTLIPKLERLPTTALVWSNGEANIFV